MERQGERYRERMDVLVGLARARIEYEHFGPLNIQLRACYDQLVTS